MFAFRLANKWGYANPDAMLAAMDATHIPEWLAFFQVEEEERLQAESAERAKSGLIRK